MTGGPWWGRAPGGGRAAGRPAAVARRRASRLTHAGERSAGALDHQAILLVTFSSEEVGRCEQLER